MDQNVNETQRVCDLAKEAIRKSRKIFSVVRRSDEFGDFVQAAVERTLVWYRREVPKRKKKKEPLPDDAHIGNVAVMCLIRVAQKQSSKKKRMPCSESVEERAAVEVCPVQRVRIAELRDAIMELSDDEYGTLKMFMAEHSSRDVAAMTNNQITKQKYLENIRSVLFKLGRRVEPSFTGETITLIQRQRHAPGEGIVEQSLTQEAVEVD